MEEDDRTAECRIWKRGWRPPHSPPPQKNPTWLNHFLRRGKRGIYIHLHPTPFPGVGGGGTSILKVTGTCRWTGYDFAVINISTGYLVALLQSSILAQGISCGPLAVINIGTGYLNRPNWLLAGYSVYHRVAFQGFPAHNVYDRPTIWAPATRRDGAISRQGMHMIFFLVRYIVNRVYFLCTGSGFRPPAAPPPPPSTWKSSAPPPPPPPGLRSRCVEYRYERTPANNVTHLIPCLTFQDYGSSCYSCVFSKTTL